MPREEGVIIWCALPVPTRTGGPLNATNFGLGTLMAIEALAAQETLGPRADDSNFRTQCALAPLHQQGFLGSSSFLGIGRSIPDEVVPVN